MAGKESERARVGKLHRPPITLHIRSAERPVSNLEAYLRTIRARLSVSPNEFADRTGVPHSSYDVAETRGRVSKINADRIITALGELCTEGDPEAESVITLLTAKELGPKKGQQIAVLVEPFQGHILFTKDRDPYLEYQSTRTEEEKWYDTIYQADTFGQAVMYIRCAFNESQVAFAGNAGISSNTLSEIERNKRPASRINTNKIIEASMLESDGKAAQLLRLKSNKMDIMTTSQLKEASVAEICEYIRILKGQTRKEVADETFLSKSQIGRLFGGDATLSTHEQTITGLWLKLPEESALAAVISQKMHNPSGEIDDALLQKVIDDKYLFADASVQIAPIQLSTAQNRLNSQVQRTSSIGQALHVLRKSLGLTQEAFAATIKDRNYTSNLISRIERGEHIPHDYTVVFLLGYLGYDIHHPITKTLLKKQVALVA